MMEGIDWVPFYSLYMLNKKWEREREAVRRHESEKDNISRTITEPVKVMPWEEFIKKA